MLQEEEKLWKEGFKYVTGIDEAGRGPLAGPVSAGAVFVSEKDFLDLRKNKLIKDSKLLLENKRKEVYEQIINDKRFKWGVGIVSEKIIDEINILEATKLAMNLAIKDLEERNNIKVDFLILDGNMKIDIEIEQKSIIGADKKVFSVSTASIIAKVKRDEIMLLYDKKYSQYNFKKHKGYGTKEHMENIKKYGKCEIHRKSFKPF
jgi:ribonuclease HII